MNNDIKSLEKFLSEQPKNMQELFITIINYHADSSRDMSKNELLGAIRRKIEEQVTRGDQ